MRRVAGGARPGFVLAAVLWIAAAMALIGVEGRWVARDSVDATQNRISLERAHWIAEGCVAAARSVIDNALVASSNSARVWNGLDSIAAAALSDQPCLTRVVANGLSLDANTASGEQLRVLFDADGMPSEASSSLADALIDWRDADTVALPNGAEAPWYRRAGREGPRNAALRSARELLMIRGFDSAFVRHPELLEQLDVEAHRVWISRASAGVLAALPGMSSEAVAAIIAARAKPDSFNWQSIADGLSSANRALLLAAFPQLSAATTLTPESWRLEVDAAWTPSLPREHVQVVLANAGRRAGVARWTEWP